MKTDLWDLVQELVTVEHFCGNVNHAIRFWEKENRKLSEEERFEVLCAWGKAWQGEVNEAKKAASE